MKSFLHSYKWLLICSVVFLIHQFTEPFIELRLVDSYLDDLLFLPICLSVALIVLRFLFDTHYTMPITMVILAIILTSISTELVFPKLSKKHVGDYYDVAAYSFGALFFYFFANKVPIEQ